MTKPDYRRIAGLQLRAGAEAGRTVTGVFAAYNVVSVIDDWFQEMILPGCFAESVASGVCHYAGDVAIKCLYQHNPENVLGSMKSGTLRLKEVEAGLIGECDLPSNDLGERIRESMMRGDLDEASIGFFPTATEWVQGIDMDLIKMIKGDLKEVTIANFPKTQSTSLSLRAKLPDEVEEKQLVMRAINRFKNSGLEPADRDREILCHYRSLIEPVADEDTREVLIKALPPAKTIIPVETAQAYLKFLPKWR